MLRWRQAELPAPFRHQIGSPAGQSPGLQLVQRDRGCMFPIVRPRFGAGGDRMVIEVSVPDDWTPGLTLATARLLQRAVRDGFPLISIIREDATADEIARVSGRIRSLIQEAHLAP
jgi:hypothetical protein